jgi:carboxyl-terminal processing protease
MSEPRRRTSTVVAFSLGVCLTGACTHAFPDATASPVDAMRKLGLFGDVFEKVRTSYVERPDDDKLIEGAISGMLSSLDPHSSYLPPKEWKDMRDQTRGEFGGLGIEVAMEDGLVKVVSPIDDTPAARAGLLANDLVGKIDDETVPGLTLAQCVERMRGKPGTSVRLTVVRKGTKEPFEVTMVREVIKVRAVKARAEGEVAYLRVSQFNERTTDSLHREMDRLAGEIGKERLKGYVLDLRNNPGGLLDQAVSVAGTFITRGEIVSTRGREERDTLRFGADGKPDRSGGLPLVVLVNGGSASASEIVAGAVQDHKRGTVLGTRSWGKGSVQTLVPLGAQGALKLTTARYYTPSGRSIQAKGIEPDVVVREVVPDDLKGKDETKGEVSLKGHLINGSDADKGGSSAYVPPDAAKDTQLQAALELVRKTRP